MTIEKNHYFQRDAQDKKLWTEQFGGKIIFRFKQVASTKDEITFFDSSRGSYVKLTKENAQFSVKSKDEGFYVFNYGK